MWLVSYKDQVIEKFKTKHQAKKSIEYRDNLCYMLKSNISLYSIKKEKLNATKRIRKAWPMS